GVAQVVDSWATSEARFPAENYADAPERRADFGVRQRDPAVDDEEEGLRSTARKAPVASRCVAAQCAGGRRMERDESGLAKLRPPHVEKGGIEVDVAASESERFGDAHPRAGEESEEHGHGGRPETAGWRESCRLREQGTELALCVDMR